MSDLDQRVLEHLRGRPPLSSYEIARVLGPTWGYDLAGHTLVDKKPVEAALERLLARGLVRCEWVPFACPGRRKRVWSAV